MAVQPAPASRGSKRRGGDLAAALSKAAARAGPSTPTALARAPQVFQTVRETQSRAGNRKRVAASADAAADSRWVRRERRRVAAVEAEYDAEMAQGETEDGEHDDLPLGAATGERAWRLIGAMRDAQRRRVARQRLRQRLPLAAARTGLSSRGAHACAVARESQWILHARPQDPLSVRPSPGRD